MVGANIKKFRISLNLTQSDVAEYCEVDRATVSKWETGEFYPRTSKLLKIAKLLKCSVNDLLV